MKNNLNQALYFAEKYGWKLFPAVWNDGKHVGLVKWGDQSSNDPAAIAVWHEKWPEAYFCVNLKASGFTVLDVDNKNGKTGFLELEKIELEHKFLPETLVVETPSGGAHYLFKGDSPKGANKYGPGLDSPVMIPVPGSIVVGKGEYKIHAEKDIPDLPGYLIKMTGTRPEREIAGKPDINSIDSESYVKEAVEWLNEGAPLAVEGDGGDQITFNVACKLRDKGLSEQTAHELMVNHWNDRCQPPWDLYELETKVKNAYRYSRQSSIGAETPEALFDGIKTPQEKIDKLLASIKSLGKKIPRQKNIRGLGFLSASDVISRAGNPEWIIKRYLEKDTVTVLYGNPSSYKSFLAINMGLHVAAGLPWADQKVNQAPVFYLSGEGLGGLGRRLDAASRTLGIDLDTTPFFVSNRPVSFGSESDADALIQIFEGMKDNYGDPGLVIIDTLANSFGGGDENGTRDMVAYLNEISKIRTSHRPAIVLVHHTAKSGTIRGNIALTAGVDNQFRVGSDEESKLCILRKADKLKDGMPMPDTAFKTEIVRLGLDEDLEPITSLALTWQKNWNPSEAVPSKPKDKKNKKDIDTGILDDIKELINQNPKIPPADITSTLGAMYKKDKIESSVFKLYGENGFLGLKGDKLKDFIIKDKNENIF